jgi:Secretion system C-terminal sorting domain
MMKYGLYSTRPSGYSNITATVTNACGSTVILYDDFNRISNNNNVTIADIYKVFPNPAKDIVNIETIDTDFQPEENTTITGELFDLMGIPTTKVQIKDNKATFSVEGLRKGIYVLKIYIDDQTETHQIAVE